MWKDELVKFFKVKSRDEVLNILRKEAGTNPLDTVEVSTIDSMGRISSKDVICREDVPAFNRSTVDGYVIISRESHGATESIPAILELKGSIDMGTIPTCDIKPSETLYIPTGGMLPVSGDGVVMIEDTEQFDESSVAIMKSITSGENVIHKGDDIKESDVAIKKNQKVRFMDIGILSALGLDKVTVYKKPVVTIISTGDEIINISDDAKMGQIYDINGNVLKNLVEESGGVVIHRAIIRDDYTELFEAVKSATNNSDIVFISGGSSVGTRDFTYDVIKNLKNSEIFAQGISIKPGKPTIIGRGNGKMIFGLPGHPVSSIVIFKEFVDFYIRNLLFQPPKQENFTGTLTANIHSAPGKTTYQMVNIDGLKINPKYGKSGMISLLANADGYIVIDRDKEGLNAGELVKGFRFE